jgi:trypsin
MVPCSRCIRSLHSLGPLLLATMMLVACGVPVEPRSSSEPIVNGTLDGSAHPYVGTLAIRLPSGAWSRRCTGSLIAPSVFLTAGHCVADALDLPQGAFGVTFDPTFTPTAQVVAGSAVLHPEFPATDVAVVVLEEPVTDLGYVVLPGPRLLDVLARRGELAGQRVTLVGYGMADATAGGRVRVGAGVRRVAEAEIDSLAYAERGEWLHLRTSPIPGLGGACYGDSGSPNLFAGTTLLAGITSWGSPDCNATFFAQRIDVESARSFLAQFVALPE